MSACALDCSMLWCWFGWRHSCQGELSMPHCLDKPDAMACGHQPYFFEHLENGLVAQTVEVVKLEVGFQGWILIEESKGTEK